MMRLFYLFLLTWTRIDLTIARSAPEPNHAHIATLRRDEMQYLRALQDLEINYA